MIMIPKTWLITKLIDYIPSVPTGVKPYVGKRKYYSTGSVSGKNYLPEGEYEFHNRPSRANRVAKTGDVFQARMKGTDKALIIQETLSDQLFSTGFLQFRPIQDTYTNKFLFHFIRSDFFLKQRDEFATGSTQVALTDSKVTKLELIVPPINEQRRIVAKLEKLLQKVDTCKERLDKIPSILKRFRQSVLAAACSGRLTAEWRNKDHQMRDCDSNIPADWNFIHFRSLISEGPQNGLYKPQSAYGSGTPIVRIDAFYDGAITDWKTLKRLRLSARELEKFVLSEDDILINRVNSPKFLGKAALVRAISEDSVYESNMMRLRVDTSKVSPEYTILYLQSSQGLDELRKNAKHAVNQSSINQEDVKDVLFALPTRSEQQEIVHQVAVLFKIADRIEEHYKKARMHVDKLTQSILAKAFRGELVTQDPNDEPASELLKRIKAINQKMKQMLNQ